MLTDSDLRFVANALVRNRHRSHMPEQADQAIHALIAELGLNLRQRAIFEVYLGADQTLEVDVAKFIDDGGDLSAELGDVWADLPEGTTATCVHCGRTVLLDQREGGGAGKDWGDGPDTWRGNGGIGMDYGCGESPLNDDDGTGGHAPDVTTIVTPESEG